MYEQLDEFDKNVILDKMSEISSQITEETDSDKEFKLIYRHFCEGLKLSTGNVYM